VHSQVIEQLAEGAKKLTPGDPLDKNTRMGALVSKKQQETVLSYIKKGLDEGAQLIAGGKAAKPNGKGFYVEATVFDGVQPEMTIAREEIFGPVLAVLTFDDFEQGVKLANQTIYGLARGSGPGTSRRPIARQKRFAPGRCGSTRTTSTTRARRSAASKPPALDATSAAKPWMVISIPRRCGSGCDRRVHHCGAAHARRQTRRLVGGCTAR